jgi:uncharacterized protein involved in exopolysaccharide biosynthesis
MDQLTPLRQLDIARSGADDSIALRDLLNAVRRHRWLLVSLTVACVLGGGLAWWLLPEKYEATILLSPVSDQAGSNSLNSLGSMVSQVNGIASLAGLALPGSRGTRAESIATLQSEALTERYIRDNQLLPDLFSSRWNTRLRKWNATDPEKVPTLWKGNRYFAQHVRTVYENPKSGLVTMTIRWTDREQAARWANGLVKLTNDYLRGKAIAESERDIAYLNGEASKTNVVELRNAIYSLIESQIKKEMVARGSEEYALKVIDPAAVPEKPTSPTLLVWALIGLGAGLLSSGLVIVVVVATRANT